MTRLSSRTAGVAIVNSSSGFPARIQNSDPASVTHVVPSSLRTKILPLHAQGVAVNACATLIRRRP